MLDNRKKPDDSEELVPLPRYLQIVHEMREQIIRGDLKVHDMLPSERSLAERYNVSRMTGRRALEALETEGLVYNADRRGRFVSPQRLNYNVSNMVSFVVNAQSNDVDLEIDVIETCNATADTRISALLERPKGCSTFEYTRIFRTSDHPIFIETEYLIAEHVPDFLRHDLKQSTTQILEKTYGISAHTGDIVIRMRSVQPNEARLLNIASSQAVIELEQVIRDENGTPFCFGRQVWRGELAEFSAHTVVTRHGQTGE